MERFSFNKTQIWEEISRYRPLRLHYDVAAAIFHAHMSFPSAQWLMVQEDDFEMCQNGMKYMFSIMCEARRMQKDACGGFVATGGSGLILHRSIVNVVVHLLLKQIVSVPPHRWESDLTIQKCIKGEWPECAQCAGSLTIPSRLLFRHIGFKSARNGYQHPVEFTCEWRHAWAGTEQNVTVVITP